MLLLSRLLAGSGIAGFLVLAFGSPVSFSSTRPSANTPPTQSIPAPVPVRPLTAAITPIANLIASGESEHVGGYNAANRGRAMDLGRSGLVRVFGRDCSEVTLAEVVAAQRQGRLHAAGRYQIIGTTMIEAIRHSGLPLSARFSPANQDKLLMAILKHKRPAVWTFLQGQGRLSPALDAMAWEWSSIANAYGYSNYPGDRAHVSRDQAVLALRQSRSKFTIHPEASI